MADVEPDVSGSITLQQPFQTSKSMFQLPMQVSLSSPAAKEWFGQRRENIRPWTVFVNTGNFRTPSSIPRLSKRIMRNVEYFQSNYLFVFLGLFAYCLITSPLLLIAVAASLGACYILSVKNAERKISIFGHELSLAQQYGMIALCSLPLFYLAGAGAALFWVLGASIFIITLHAAFYNIDAILNPDDDRIDLMMEEMIRNIAVICVMLLVWICVVSAQDSILLTMKPILPPYQGGPWVYPKPTTARPTIQQQ